MTGENAAKQDEGAAEDNDAELDQAIDDLRGVLKKGQEPAHDAGDDNETGAAEDGRPKYGSDDMSTASGKAFADFDDFGAPSVGADKPSGRAQGSRMDLVMNIPIDVQIVLGTSRMPVSALMNLSEGSTIALERKIGEPVEITVNGRVIGHGEITVMDDDESRFGVRLLDVDTGKE